MAVTHNVTLVIDGGTYTMQSDLAISGDISIKPVDVVETSINKRKLLIEFIEYLGRVGDKFGAIITSLTATWNATIFDIEIVANGVTYTVHSDLAITGGASIKADDSDLTNTRCLACMIQLVNKMSAIGINFGSVITSLSVTAI